jgi:hypothetical protein
MVLQSLALVVPTKATVYACLGLPSGNVLDKGLMEFPLRMQAHLAAS